VTREAGRKETESRLTTHAPERAAGTTRVMEENCDRENLKEALRGVKANKSSPGIDEITVNQLDNYLEQHWPARVWVANYVFEHHVFIVDVAFRQMG
jgi:hypothetical protein